MAELLIIAASVFAYSLVSERLQASPVTAPMVFTTIGLVLGPAGVGWFDLDLDDSSVEVLVEATLVLVLFTDATRIDLRALRQESGLPARLLGIGFPLTFISGAVAAALLFTDLTVIEAALIAAILTPTDAALGQAVVSDRRLPVRIRQGLNVESGLNDGFALPLVAVLLALAANDADATTYDSVGRFVAGQIGFGFIFGVAVGGAGGLLMRSQSLSGRVEGVYRQLGTIALAVAAFAAASLVDGNGFIAAFVAGLAFGAVAREQCNDLQDFTEDEGELLTVVTFTVFGAVLAGPVLDEFSARVLLYAVLSLTLVRMVPVLVAMVGSGTLAETRLFAGWFGPRGLASILFALVVVEEMHGGGGVDDVFMVVVATVLLSVYAHGLTAWPWVGRLSRRLADGPADMPEMMAVPEMRSRRPMD